MKLIITDVIGCKDTDLFFPPTMDMIRYSYMSAFYPLFSHKMAFNDVYFFADALSKTLQRICKDRPDALFTLEGGK